MTVWRTNYLTKLRETTKLLKELLKIVEGGFPEEIFITHTAEDNYAKGLKVLIQTFEEHEGNIRLKTAKSLSVIDGITKGYVHIKKAFDEQKTNNKEK